MIEKREAIADSARPRILIWVVSGGGLIAKERSAPFCLAADFDGFSAIGQMVTILVVPFWDWPLNPDYVQTNHWLREIYLTLALHSNQQFLFWIGSESSSRSFLRMSPPC